MRRANRRRQFQQAVRPAPFRGVNQIERLESETDGFAESLINSIPNQGSVETRLGSSLHCNITGETGSVKTLIPYVGTSASLFAVTDSDLYDVSSSTSSDEGLTVTNGFCSHTIFANTSGTYLFIVNGEDKMLRYDGTDWETETTDFDFDAAGVVTSDEFNFIHAHKNRIWTIEKDTLSGYYAPTAAIATSAMAEFSFAGLPGLGGTLIAFATWSVDSGSGLDDLFVAATTEGQIIVYQGTDPSSASTWSLVGVYQADRPKNNRCFQKFGADLYFLTETGIYSLAKLLREDARAATISRLVRPEFISRSAGTTATLGWQIFQYPEKGWILANTPLSSNRYHQIVQNTTASGPEEGWCFFEDMDSVCWGLHNSKLYYGTSDGKIFEYDQGFQDDDVAVESTIIPAWDYFGDTTRKRFNSVRFQVLTASSPAIEVGIITDYNPSLDNLYTPTLDGAEVVSVWDSAAWDTSLWAPVDTYFKALTGVAGEGLVGSMAMRVTGRAETFVYSQYTVTFEPGSMF